MKCGVLQRQGAAGRELTGDPCSIPGVADDMRCDRRQVIFPDLSVWVDEL